MAKKTTSQAPADSTRLSERAEALSGDGGILHIATDWMPYAEHVLEVVSADERFEPMTDVSAADDPLFNRHASRFERRGRRLGHEVIDLYYRAR